MLSSWSLNLDSICLVSKLYLHSIFQDWMDGRNSVKFWTTCQCALVQCFLLRPMNVYTTGTFIKIFSTKDENYLLPQNTGIQLNFCIQTRAEKTSILTVTNFSMYFSCIFHNGSADSSKDCPNLNERDPSGSASLHWPENKVTLSSVPVLTEFG